MIVNDVIRVLSSNESNDDGPDTNISFEIGVIGIILFAFLIAIAIHAYCIAINKYSKSMFFYSFVFSALELPRYICLVVQRAYTNQIAYVFHMEGKK